MRFICLVPFLRNNPFKESERERERESGERESEGWVRKMIPDKMEKSSKRRGLKE